MTNNPASLENLRDIVIPPDVSMWPPAPGWWVLFALVSGLVIFFCIRGWLKWRANAYRRAALYELKNALSSAKVSEILKRTALAAYPRTSMAALTGDAWCSWLEGTGNSPMPASVRTVLIEGIFAENDDQDIEELIRFASRWISTHQPIAVQEGQSTC